MEKLEKLIDTVNYLLSLNNGRLNYTKLIKLLYIADRELLTEYGFAITGDSYYSLPNGPILSTLYDLVKKEAPSSKQVEWDNYFYKDGYDLLGDKLNRPIQELTELEMEKIREVDKRYKELSYSQLIKKLHNPSFCPEWTDPGISNIPISYADILTKYGGKDIDTAKEIIEEYESIEEENAFLHSHCR